MTDEDLIATARRAKGSAVLPTVSFGAMNAEALILRMADRIEALEAELQAVTEALEAELKMAKLSLQWYDDTLEAREAELTAARVQIERLTHAPR